MLNQLSMVIHVQCTPFATRITNSQKAHICNQFLDITMGGMENILEEQDRNLRRALPRYWQTANLLALTRLCRGSYIRRPLGTSDSQLLHPKLERWPFESKTRSRAIRTGKNPIGLLEDSKDMPSLNVLKRR